MSEKPDQASAAHQRALGMLRSWRPELPDHRDRVFASPAGTVRDVVPQIGAALGVRVHDQGPFSSCTGFAVSSVIEIVLRRRGDKGQLSPLFPYSLAREMIGELHLDAGAYNRDVIKASMQHGIPRETTWRYSPANLHRWPTSSAFTAAQLVRAELQAMAASYERVQGLPALLAAISAGLPVLFGFMCFPRVFGLTAQDYALPLPQQHETPIGGHAVYADGYSVPDRLIYVGNSWGAKWGRRGSFAMPFDWFTDGRRLVDDLWVVRPTA